MAHLEDLKQRYENHRRRLQKLEEQHARSGYSTEPTILLEIEDIKKDLATLDAQISAHSDLLNLFMQYENGFDHVLHQLGRHSRCKDVLEYQHLMQAHIDHVREAGDTPSSSAERERILDRLNVLANQLLGKSFKRLMRLPSRGTTSRSPTPPPSSLSPAQPSDVGTSSIISIQNQNNVTGDHNVIGDHNVTGGHNIINKASYQNIYYGPVGLVSNDPVLSHCIANIEQAVVSGTAPPLRQQALQQIGRFRQATSVADVASMAAALAWFEQHLPGRLAQQLQALICHPNLARAIQIVGAEAYADYQRHFGRLDGCEEHS